MYKKAVYLTKKAYCFKFNHSCYDLVLDIANTMISMMKDSWVHELNRLSIADSRSSEASTTLNKELSAYLRNELITGEMKNMLDEISLYDFSKHTGSNIQHRAQGEIMWINYTQPSLREYKYYDTKWFCPILFQNLSLENFIMALFAIMLEKSIIFISKDVQYCSCVVLGLKNLIEPFRICFAIIPVMPQHVIEYLSAPVPLLVGLPSNLVEINKIDYQNFEADMAEDLNWVNLDDESQSKWNSEMTLPFCAGLKEKIREDYDFIRSFPKSLIEHQSDEVDQKVRSIVDIIKDCIFDTFINPIPLSIGFSVEQDSDSKFPREVKSPRTQERLSKIDRDEIKIENPVDEKFFQEFYDSLMFQTFLEEYNKDSEE